MATTPVLLPGKFHGQRSLVGYSPWDHEESDTTERRSFTFRSDRVPEELWTEVCDIVQEAGIKTIPKKKKCKKAKQLSEETLQIAVKRESKCKGEKERYTHLNAEFQRIAWRDKKGFLSDQCKEIRENNRKGKTRDLGQKIRDTKGTFHVKMGSTKNRNGMDLTEAEDIKKRWQNTQKNCTKKSFTTQIITMV